MGSIINWKKTTPSFHVQNPFTLLQEDLDRAMSEFNKIFEVNRLATGKNGLKLNPRIDIIEDKDNFKVEAELPGMAEEDIQVTVENGLLTIKGEKELSKKDEDKNYVMREISYGSYERTIALPDYVDVDKAKASFKKGMLWVTLPKKAEAAKQSKQIKIEKAS